MPSPRMTTHGRRSSATRAEIERPDNARSIEIEAALSISRVDPQVDGCLQASASLTGFFSHDQYVGHSGQSVHGFEQ